MGKPMLILKIIQIQFKAYNPSVAYNGLMGSEAPLVWPNGWKCAVSLTYDGACDEHVSYGVPLLDQLSLCATFFVNPTGLLSQPIAWKTIGQKHEIGNHSLYGVT